MTTTTIDTLRPGADYPAGNINARLTYTDEEIAELAASLVIDGQLRPLLCCSHETHQGLYFVFGGGRRLLAYQALVRDGRIPTDHPIDIVDFGQLSVTEAMSKSFADNKAVPMHPADLAKSFAALALDLTPEDLARDRGMTLRSVKQLLALGQGLASDILDAWRAGNISREVAEVFSICDDFEAQETQLEWLKTTWEWGAHKPLNTKELRKRLTKNKEPEIRRLLGFVKDEYIAAGGEVIEDMFTDGCLAKDLKLLRKAAKDKLASIEVDLLDQGWGWVETMMSSNGISPIYTKGYGHTKVTVKHTDEEKTRLSEIEARQEVLEEEADDYAFMVMQNTEYSNLDDEKAAIKTAATLRAFTDKLRHKSGVLVMVNNDGSLNYEYGLKRLSGAAAASSGSTQKERAKPSEPDINYNVRRSISDWMEDATAAELIKHPRETFIYYLASSNCTSENVPFDIWHGFNGNGDGDENLHDTVRALASKSADELIEYAAALMARQVSIEDDSLHPSIIEIVGADNLQQAMAERYDPAVYFAGASTLHTLAAINDALGETARDEAEALGPDGARTYAIDHLTADVWLPHYLRISANTAEKKAA